MGVSHSSIDDARLAKQALKSSLRSLDGVVGIGLTRAGAGYALKVNVQAALANKIPSQCAGVPVVVEVVGAVRAQRPSGPINSQRPRPLAKPAKLRRAA
jgi:hypothetical protein